MVSIVCMFVDGCIRGDVRSPLLGGASENEGIVEVCANGTFLTVSLDDGRFSVKEATVICRHLGRGNGKLDGDLVHEILHFNVPTKLAALQLFVGLRL